MIALTGERAVVLVDATAGGGNAAVNRINLAIKDALVSVGHELISTTADGGGRNQYTLVSQRFPWWHDFLPAPSSYSGRVETLLFAVDNNSFSQNARDVDHVFSGGPTSPTNLGVFSGEYWIIVTPFSAVVMKKGATGGPNGNIAIWGVLNTPKFIQERGLREAIYCIRADLWRAGLQRITGSGASFYLLYQDSTVTSEIQGTLAVQTPLLLHTQWQGDNDIGAKTAVAFPNLIDDPTLADTDLWYPMLNCAKLTWPDVNGGPQRSRGWICDLVTRVKRQTSLDGIDFTPGGHQILWISVTSGGGLNNNAVLGVVIGGLDCPVIM